MDTRYPGGIAGGPLYVPRIFGAKKPIGSSGAPEVQLKNKERFQLFFKTSPPNLFYFITQINSQVLKSSKIHFEKEKERKKTILEEKNYGLIPALHPSPPRPSPHPLVFSTPRHRTLPNIHQHKSVFPGTPAPGIHLPSKETVPQATTCPFCANHGLPLLS